MVRGPRADTSSEATPPAARGNPGTLARREWTDEERAAWRRRREKRRAKQRAQNVVRARAMHDARLQHEAEHVAQSPPAVQTKYGTFVGCSGWYYWHWRECFYPPTIPGSKWFDHYASRFRTVELNAPFYSWPTIASVENWTRQAGRRRFVYSIKVNELITHTKRFVGTRTLVRDFGYIADLLGPRFGCFLFQLPPSFHYSAAALKRIVTQLDPSRRNVVEFRHRSWWNERVSDAFRDAGITFCSCSGPRLPDQLVRTADDVYVRFHGTTRWYRHDYSVEELKVWADRITDSGARRLWAYFNNDREGYAIKNARALIRLLKRTERGSQCKQRGLCL
jgi:uncharacterized protein YecE (DUF72 family)